MSPAGTAGREAALPVMRSSATGLRSLASRYGASIAILAFGVLLVGLLWGVVAFKIRAERDAEIRTATKETGNLARVFEEHVLRTIREADQVLQFIIHQYAARGTAVDLRGRMEEGPVVSRIYTYLSIIDARGDLIAGSQPFGPVNLADRDHFRVHEAGDTGQIYISKPVLGRASGKWSIQLSRRINNPDRSFGGVAVISINPEYFAQLYSQTDLGSEAMITLVGRDGAVRARRSRNEANATVDTSRWTLFKMLPSSRNGSYVSTSSVDGLTRIFSYRSLTDYPLVVLVGAAEYEELADFNERRRGYIGAAALATLVIVGFTIFLLGLVRRRENMAKMLRRHNADLGRALEANTRLAAIVENSNDAIISRALDGSVTSWNAGAERVFGYAAAEAIGRPISDLILPPEIRGRVAQNIESIQRGEIVAPYETRRRTKDGRIVDVLSSVSPVRDEAGAITGASVIMRDISALKRAEAERAQLAAIVRSSDDAIVSTTPDGVIQTWNAGAERLFGHTTAEAIGKPIALLYAAEEQPAARRNLEAIKQGERHYEATRVRHDGSQVPVSVTAFPILAQAGAIAGVGAIYRDVSERRKAEAARAELAAIVEQSNDAIITRSPDGRFQSWNKGAERMFGYTAAEAIGQSISLILPPEERSEIAAKIERTRRGVAPVPYETRRVTRDGRVIDVLASVSPVKDAAGEVASVSIIFHDISERKKADAAVKASETRLRAILDNDSECVALISPKGVLMEINRAGLAMLEAATIEQVRSHGLANFVRSEHRDRFREFFRKGANNEPAQVEFEISGLRGARRWLQSRLAPLHLPENGGANLLVVARDVTEHKRTQEKIEYLSNHDTLTGLPNRNLFHDRLELAVAHARRRGEVLGVLLANLDRFKKVNESLGHEAGDKLLRDVASRLKSSLRDVDTIARLGGDDYAILVEGAGGVDDVTAVAEKVIQTLAAPFEVRDHEIFVSASIGVASCVNGACTAGKLLESAEVAAARAKRDGGGGYHLYKDEPITLSGRRLTLESRLRRALENGELGVHYQPKIDLLSGNVTGAEALLRWNSPELGAVSPAQFIPIAEETGLIVPIGAWILEAACTQAARWRREGHDFSIAVNLSPRQFRQKVLVSMVAGILKRSGLEAPRLELEITEGTAMSNAEQTIAVLAELHQLGVKLAVDDFGTGYSSLSYLRRFPLHCLKIDRSFVRDAAANTDSAAIVRATIALAHSLRLRVVAEGIETEAQRALLLHAACDEGQGFLFSKPLPAEAFAALLESRRPARAGRSNVLV